MNHKPLGPKIVHHVQDPRGPQGPAPDWTEELDAMTKLPCDFCGQPIGYDQDFYAIMMETCGKWLAAHRGCMEKEAQARADAIRPQMERVKASLGIGQDGLVDAPPGLGTLRCNGCNQELPDGHMTCSEAPGGAWCSECFNWTACGLGCHGEACPTAISRTNEDQTPDPQ